MKALIKENQVIQVEWAIPHDFNKDGVIIPHYCHEYTPEVWYADGWRDVVLPEFDETTQRLSEAFYDDSIDKAVFVVINTLTPAFDPETQRLGEKYFDAESGTDTFRVVDIPQEELDQIVAIKTKQEADRIKRMATLTKYAFLSRFTTQEKLAIFGAESSNVMIRLFLETFRVCSDIELTNLETIQGVQMLESSGLIAPGRASEILHYLS